MLGGDRDCYSLKVKRRVPYPPNISNPAFRKTMGAAGQPSTKKATPSGMPERLWGLASGPYHVVDTAMAQDTVNDCFDRWFGEPAEEPSLSATTDSAAAAAAIAIAAAAAAAIVIAIAACAADPGAPGPNVTLAFAVCSTATTSRWSTSHP